ncbi:hypothetical protein VNO78_05720 [Psophocarpus tetragonolobus]|uniref:Uncharacterized protein n=1 Tax=Psophocarpus tetragonolobus TaxID=3891 RepID=A0AAN9T098_PSOTE
MRFSCTASEYGLHICTKLREYRYEISQEGTLDDLSVTLTIHLLNDMKAYKEVGSLRDGTCSVFQVVSILACVVSANALAPLAA